ncbi:hypothetical protein [Konateibacter massiliensis]|uniref:hypothetical protein n=1 Tax=Konateibacter massiliensis TaxID=2002841 RepID=UPI000C159A4A|nr:hypothetical protein [Konateibacter massiliensis]
MNEEVILKSQFWGGYNKQDVLQYVDDLLEENEQRVKQMEEQIEQLERENRILKAKGQAKLPIAFPAGNIAIENVKNLSVKEQMKLPEGSYMRKESKVVALSEGYLPSLNENQNNHNKKQASKNEPVMEAAAYIAASEELVLQAEEIVPMEAGEFEELRVKIAALQAELEAEQHEKQMIMAKLEFSNDLLLNLYAHLPDRK